MKTVELKLNVDNLGIYVYDDSHPEVEPLDMSGEAGYFYLRTFYNNKIRNVIEDKKDIDVLISYDGCNLKLSNYVEILENEDYRNTLMPILQKSMDFLERKQSRKSKNKKVKRVNKYKVRITAAILALAMLASIAKVSSKGPIESINSDDLDLDDNSYTIENIIEENDNEDKLSIETLEMVQKAEDVAEIKVVKSVEPSKETIEPDPPDNYVSLDYGSRSDSEKANTTRANYSSIIEKYSNQYGLDSDLIIALATQERGIHSGTMDPGGATGLMQIQNSVWDGGTLRAYNFNTNSWEQITVDIPSLSDLEYNIRIGCMIFQDCLRNTDYNIMMALQSYNMGYGTIYNLVNQYCSQTGKVKDQVYLNQTDIGWMDYRNTIPYGDSQYIENVLSYYNGSGTIKVISPDGVISAISIGNGLKQDKKL